MIASMWATYFSSARRPAAVRRYSVRGTRPSNDLSHEMYCASSSFRAWTLRLPSVVCRSRLRSLNVNRSFAASALTMPRRSRSWMMRSRAIADCCAVTAGFVAPADLVAGLRAADDLATVSPRDEASEHDVKAAESGGQKVVAPGGGRRERDGAERHEREPHQRYDADRQGAAGRDRRSVEQQPAAGQPHRETERGEDRGENHPGDERRRVREREAPRRRGSGERRPGALRLARNRGETDRRGDRRVRKPDQHPALRVVGRSGDSRRDQRGRAHRDATPPRHRSELAGPRHRLADEPQALRRMRLNRLDAARHRELYSTKRTERLEA